MILEILSPILSSGIVGGLVIGFVRHYHHLRTTNLELKHTANITAINAIGNDVGEMKRGFSHLHECLEDLKGKVASSNSHEQRISRLEDAIIRRPQA